MQLMKLDEAERLTGVTRDMIEGFARIGKIKLYGTASEPLVDVGRLYKIRMRAILRRTLQGK